MILPPARCPVCDWELAAPSAAVQALAEVVAKLEGHLAERHDVTWELATQLAHAWARKALAASRGSTG